MDIKKTSVLEQYYMRVSKIIIIIYLISIHGAYLYTVIDKFRNVGIIAFNRVFLFLLIIMLESAIYVYMYIHFLKNDRLDMKFFEILKIFTCLIVIVDFILFESYQPSRQVWCQGIYYCILIAFFIDMTATIIIDTLMAIFMICSIVLKSVKKLGYFEIYAIWDETKFNILIILLITVGMTILVYLISHVFFKLQEQEQIYKDDYYKKVEQNSKEIREIRHNIKNQIIVLQGMLESNKIEDAKEMLKSILTDISSSQSGIYTKNIAVNSIINSKVKSSQIYNIEWKIRVAINEDLNVCLNDIGIILGNILDNAIEASRLIESDLRIIELDIQGYDNNILIHLKNNKSKKQKAKNDKLNHGIGLKSVSKIIHKYHGCMDTICKDDTFETNILLWNI